MTESLVSSRKGNLGRISVLAFHLEVSGIEHMRMKDTKMLF